MNGLYRLMDTLAWMFLTLAGIQASAQWGWLLDPWGLVVAGGLIGWLRRAFLGWEYPIPGSGTTSTATTDATTND